MHKGALMLGLSLSLVQRQECGVVVNKWAPFLDLYKDLSAMMHFGFGKRGKRYQDYKQTLERIQEVVFVADMPNDTRVAGCWNLMRDSLRHMFALTYYAEQKRDFCRKILDASQWAQLAEFEAIISATGEICYSSQSNRVETAGEMVLELAFLKFGYDHNNVYEVVDVRAKKPWPAEKTFRELPKLRMATSATVGRAKNIP
jgi:hypothetical protein